MVSWPKRDMYVCMYYEILEQVFSREIGWIFSSRKSGIASSRFELNVAHFCSLLEKYALDI